MIEHEFWKDFFYFLRPSYALALPTRKTLSTALLDSHYEEVKSDVERSIAASGHLTLELDGWSNIRSEGTSEFIGTEIVNVTNQYNPNKCIAIITDNAANKKRLPLL